MLFEQEQGEAVGQYVVRLYAGRTKACGGGGVIRVVGEAGGARAAGASRQRASEGGGEAMVEVGH